jgi:hypothetical protein
MRIAILLYGYFYIDNEMTLWRAPHSKVQLNNYFFVEDSYPHFISHIYTPLKTMYQFVDVYMITHEFDHSRFRELKKELLETCKFFNIIFTNRLESPRLPYTYYNLLKFVASKKKKYDRYLITRNDLFYKAKITYWIPKFTEKDFCWYLFKDYLVTWTKDKIISDAIFVVDNINNGISKFMDCIYKYIKIYPERNDLHGMYKLMITYYYKNVDCVVEGFFDSNTAKNVKESSNPIYVMINRKYYFNENNSFNKNDGIIFSLKNPCKISQKIIEKSYNNTNIISGSKVNKEETQQKINPSTNFIVLPSKIPKIPKKKNKKKSNENINEKIKRKLLNKIIIFDDKNNIKKNKKKPKPKKQKK